MTSALFLTFALGVVIGQASPPKLRVTMISLPVTDSARSAAFYGETLGLEMLGKPGEVTLFRAGDMTIVLNQPAGRGDRNRNASAIEIIFPSESVGSDYKNLSERGCIFIAAPHQVTPGRWAATFTDPDGHLLTLLGPQ